MKAILEFDLDCHEDRERFEKANKAEKMDIFIEEVWEQLFRPIRKHGYSDTKLVKLLEELGYDEDGSLKAYELMWYLGEKYYELEKEML